MNDPILDIANEFESWKEIPWLKPPMPVLADELKEGT